jgi:hypothetical protein
MPARSPLQRCSMTPCNKSVRRTVKVIVAAVRDQKEGRSW